MPYDTRLLFWVCLFELQGNRDYDSHGSEYRVNTRSYLTTEFQKS